MLGHQPSFRHFLYTAVANIATLIFVVIGTIVVVALAQGYSYDVASGEVSLSGLLRVESQPVTAEVFIDGESTNERTSFKETVSEGVHSIELRADGYRPWTKDVQVRGGIVEWLRYPRLIPVDLQEVSVFAQPARELLSFSPDGNYVVRSVSGSIELWDLTNISKNPQQIALPTLTDATVQSVVWDTSGAQAIFTVGTEEPVRLLFTSSSAGVTDITAAMEKFTPVGLTANHIIAQRANDDLWAINISNGALTPLSTKVSDYSLTTANVAWIEESGVFVWDGEQSVAIETLNDTTLADIEIFTFEGETQLSGVGIEGGIVVRDIFGTQKVRSINAATQMIDISKNGQYVLFKAGADYRSFDTDKGRIHQFNFQEAPIKDIRWGDGSTLLAMQGESLITFEFDGENRQVLSTAPNINTAVLSTTGRSVYVVSEAPQSDSIIFNKISLVAQDN